MVMTPVLLTDPSCLPEGSAVWLSAIEPVAKGQVARPDGDVGRFLIAASRQHVEAVHGCIRPVGKIGLRRRVGVLEVGVELGPVAAIAVLDELRDGDGRQDGDDAHDDHELDQREALLSFLFRESANHVKPSFFFSKALRLLIYPIRKNGRRLHRRHHRP